jgi:hypothetical protein
VDEVPSTFAGRYAQADWLFVVNKKKNVPKNRVLLSTSDGSPAAKLSRNRLEEPWAGSAFDGSKLPVRRLMGTFVYDGLSLTWPMAGTTG